MPAKGFLTQTQKENLQKALKESDSHYLREKVLMLLLMNEGKTYKEISNFLGCSYRRVAYWCVHGDPDNLETLRDKRERGNYRKVTEAYIQLLMQTIEKEPTEMGYAFDRWTALRLSSYLAQETGIKLSGEQIRRILKQKKCVPFRGKYSQTKKQKSNTRELFKETNFHPKSYENKRVNSC